jgi:hypothetical protein
MELLLYPEREKSMSVRIFVIILEKESLEGML